MVRPFTSLAIIVDLIGRRLNRLLLIVGVVIAMPSAASQALGQGESVVDPRDDVRGSAAFDLASAGQGRSRGLIVHTMTTYKSWKPALLAPGGEISFYFDTNADGHADRRLDVVHHGGGLSSVMRNRGGHLVGDGLARQRGARALEVTFAPALLGKGVEHYRWFAFAGVRCGHRYVRCGDTVPERGQWISRRLRGPGELFDPRPIAGRGYRLAYDEEFLDLSGWTRRIWYDDAPAAGAVSVENGNLILRARRADGWKNVTATTLGTRSFRRGYFEARMRWTKGNGSWPAFWLMSTTHAKNQNVPMPACARPTCRSAELDVFEGQGVEPDVFYGTLHRDSCECYGSPDDQNDNNYHPTGIDLSAGWHVYSALWTEKEITWYLDGRRLMTSPVYDSTNQPMFILFDMWLGGWTVDVDAATPAELVTEVDWVRVWQLPSKQPG